MATVTPVTVGTSLRVTPRHIESRDGARVELTVDIEDGRIQEERQIDNLPTVRKSNISTLAVVGNDQTLLIGGYNSSQNTEQVDKVPFLGDIPGLGIFFSNKSKTVQRRERLFLIRPRVVAINGEVVGTPGGASNMAPMLNATWGGGDTPMTAGQYLDLAQSQRTRVLFGPNVEVRSSGGPVRASEWLQGMPTAAPLLEGKSSATQGPVIQVEPVAAPGTGRAP